MSDHAIPTTYNGVRFRSRLEARWAAFFDLCKWPWSYEPLDLKGYIPDFILSFKSPLLVEVKPLMWDSSFEEQEAVTAAQRKIATAGWRKESIIVGARVIQGPVLDNKLGVCSDRHVHYDAFDTPVSAEFIWDDAFYYCCSNCKQATFGNTTQSWRCRTSDCYDGDHYLTDGWDAAAMFNEAGNKVQWKAPQSSIVKTRGKVRTKPRARMYRPDPVICTCNGGFAKVTWNGRKCCVRCYQHYLHELE